MLKEERQNLKERKQRMETIVANVILVIIMLIFAVYIFKSVIKRINQSAKKWFLDKLQDYNYLVEEKEKQLEELREQIEEAKRKLKVVKQVEEEPESIFSKEIEEKLEKMKAYKNAPSQIPIRPEVIYDIPTPQYKETSFFRNYKQLKQNFDINPEETIKTFLTEHKEDKTREEYNILKEFRKKFTDKILYECSTLEKQEQYELVDSVLTPEERGLLKLKENYPRKNEFTIRKLIEQVEETMKQIDPTIYVYTSKPDEKYEYLDNRIKTRVYKNMSEGVIIHYQGKMYDYSV